MICLLGYMGSGKSTVGKELASILGIDFIDLDNTIENYIGKSVSQIFNEYGEYFFRKIERKILQDLLSSHSKVISLGGGTPCFYDNISLINKSSTSIYIKVNNEDLAFRLKSEKNKRPLIADKSDSELLKFITNQIKSRGKYYNQAKYTINNNDLQNTVAKIVDLKL